MFIGIIKLQRTATDHTLRNLFMYADLTWQKIQHMEGEGMCLKSVCAISLSLKIGDSKC